MASAWTATEGGEGGSGRARLGGGGEVDHAFGAAHTEGARDGLVEGRFAVRVSEHPCGVGMGRVGMGAA